MLQSICVKIHLFHRNAEKLTFAVFNLELVSNRITYSPLVVHVTNIRHAHHLKPSVIKRTVKNELTDRMGTAQSKLRNVTDMADISV